MDDSTRPFCFWRTYFHKKAIASVSFIIRWAIHALDIYEDDDEE